MSFVGEFAESAKQALRAEVAKVEKRIIDGDPTAVAQRAKDQGMRLGLIAAQAVIARQAKAYEQGDPGDDEGDKV